MGSNTAAALALATAAFAAPLNAAAEPGDYSFFQTLRNLVSPPRADNPVRADQRSGDYPMLANPAGFADGFRPGDYLDWQTVELAPQTGAVCGNGTPYRFFVNRVAGTRNTVFYFEGGGACWDYDSCTGRVSGQGVRNRDGIGPDYMKFNQFVSPFIFRLHPFDRVKTQDWNIVYLPYCTGDIYTGDRVVVYQDPQKKDPDLVWHHNGLRNVRAALGWVKDNLPRPTQMLATGCSAGGVGSFTNYAHLRRDIAPDRGFLINDSGPIFPTPAAANPAVFPSQPLHTRIRSAWGLDTGMLRIYDRELPVFTRADIGSLYQGLAMRWTGDRFGHVHFWDDLVYSRYSYATFFPEIGKAPDAATRNRLQLEKFAADTARLQNTLEELPNFGGYFPRFRDVTESHCATIIDFANGDIQERGLELGDFVASVLNGSGPVLDASETNTTIDRAKPQNVIYWLIANGNEILDRIREFFGGLFS